MVKLFQFGEEKVAKKETWAFRVSEVGKSSMLFGFKSHCGKWPRNQWRVEQDLHNEGPNVAAQEFGLYSLGSKESFQIFKELNDIVVFRS